MIIVFANRNVTVGAAYWDIVRLHVAFRVSQIKIAIQSAAHLALAPIQVSVRAKK